MKDKKDRFTQFIHKYNILEPFTFIGGLVLSIWLIIIGNMKFPFDITSIVIALGLIVLIAIVILTECYHNLMIKSCYDKTLEDLYLQIGSSRYGHMVRCTDSAVGSCSRHKYHCCVMSLIESDFYKNILNKTVMSAKELSEYNLISDTDFDEKEKKYFKEHPNGEIWVISNALETEIDIDDGKNGHKPDLSLRQSMEVVENNIKNGGKYIQFVSLGIYGEDNEFLKRRQKYWEARSDLKNDAERKKVMPVIRIDSDFTNVGMKRELFNDPDWAFMVKLTSTIIFVDETEHFSEGYFCFRPEDNSNAEEYERRTILFEMPNYCMLNDIVKDLKKIKEDYNKKLENEIAT